MSTYISDVKKKEKDSCSCLKWKYNTLCDGECPSQICIIHKGEVVMKQEGMTFVTSSISHSFKVLGKGKQNV